MTTQGPVDEQGTKSSFPDTSEPNPATPGRELTGFVGAESQGRWTVDQRILRGLAVPMFSNANFRQPVIFP